MTTSDGYYFSMIGRVLEFEDEFQRCFPAGTLTCSSFYSGDVRSLRSNLRDRPAANSHSRRLQRRPAEGWMAD